MRHNRYTYSFLDYFVPGFIGIVGLALVVMLGWSIYWHCKYKCVASHWEMDTCYHSIPSGDSFIMIPYDCKTEKCDHWIER